MQTSNHTHEEILNAAEELFARHGIAATSLRAIVKQAGVNVAAIHYHFGSKEKLTSAVFNRHIDKINDERMRLLDELLRNESVPALQNIVHAFLAPMFHYFARQPERIRGLFARLHSEPEWTLPVIRQHHGILEEFRKAFQTAVPQLTADQVRYRMIFMIGTTGIVLSGQHPALNELTDKWNNPEEILREIIIYNSAGMAAHS